MWLNTVSALVNVFINICFGWAVRAIQSQFQFHFSLFTACFLEFMMCIIFVQSIGSIFAVSRDVYVSVFDCHANYSFYGQMNGQFSVCFFLTISRSEALYGSHIIDQFKWSQTKKNFYEKMIKWSPIHFPAWSGAHDYNL